MEAMLHLIMNLVAFGLAGLAILAAVTIGFGDVHALRHPVPRTLTTVFLAVLGLWILSSGIQHMVSR